MTTIVTAEPSDRRWIADLIGSAFHQLGAAQWLVPDPAERARILPRNFEIIVDYALQYGEVNVAGGGIGAAVWLPRGYTEMPPPADYDRRLAEACGEATPRFQHLDELFDAHHPEQPHHHLAFLAVAQSEQGRGIGSALLRHYHTHLDAAGQPAFLEASSTSSRDLYARHGYTMHGEPYALPSGATFYPMWRDPSSR